MYIMSKTYMESRYPSKLVVVKGINNSYTCPYFGKVFVFSLSNLESYFNILNIL